MKKLLLLSVLISISQFGFSQVGINTTSPNAQLEIKSSNQITPANTDGILIPKIDAFPSINPTAAQQGMMVYLTTVLLGKQPGFYYWDNPTVSWIGVGADAKGWELLGNAATNPTVNFIGTTDDKDVVFKRNGVRSGLIGTDSAAFGNNALNVASTGVNNLAIGAQTLTENTTGYENVAIGSLTLVKNTTGRLNTAIGVDALHFNISGQQNTALGNGALVYNETGVANVAVGNVSLRSNKTSHYNTAVGWQSMYANDGGSHNTGVGANSMFNNTTGIWNTTVGVNSMMANQTGNNNVAMGMEALNANSTGNDNTAIGTGALKVSAVSGNVAVGKDAMSSNNSGLYNAAVGTFSLKNNISGSYNSALGYQALNANTTGSLNTAIGTNAMLENKEGAQNVAIGYAALQKNNDGTPAGGVLNIAVGNNSLAQNTTGGSNTAIGHSALFKNTTGTWNVAVGNISLYENTTGFNNTAVGFWALEKNVDGGFNTALGMNTLYKIQSGSDNTAIGYQSMLNLETGTNNTGLGAWSMQAQTAGSGNIAIGRNINLASLTASNQLNIGNAIYGVDINTTATAKIGIGVVPTEKLEVAGKTKTTNLQVTSGAAAGRILISDAVGNGIWTTSNSVASGTLDQAYDFGGAGLGRTITADSGAVTIAGTDGLVSIGTLNSGAIVPSGTGVRMVWNPRKAAFRAGDPVGNAWDDISVGIYSTAQGYKTTASGITSTAFGSNTLASGDNSTAFGGNTIASGSSSTAFGFSTKARDFAAVAFGDVTDASGYISTAFGYGTIASGQYSTVFGRETTASGQISTVFGRQNVAPSYAETVLGIGATIYTPSTNGTNEFGPANVSDRLLVVGNAIDQNANFQVDNIERRDALVILKNGNTGIGNSAPALARLQVQGAVGNTVAMFSGSANSQGVSVVSDWPGIYFNSYYSGGTRSMSSTGFTSIVNTDQSTGGLIFQTTNVVNPAAGSIVGTIPTRMTIMGNGNVGIGTPTPNGLFELGLDQGRKPGTSTWTITSDERLKTIHGTYSKGLEEILKLQPITYNYVNSGNRTFEEKVLRKEFSGFSAQAVQKIFPEAVGVDDDGFLNFTMHPILVAFVNAFKELDTKNKALQIQLEEIKTQQDEINSLKAINEEILKRLEKLENK